MIKPMLTKPDEFTATEKYDDMGVLLSINLHRDDMGMIIGKGGETIKAIRHLVRIVGLIAKKRISVRINEPEL